MVVMVCFCEIKWTRDMTSYSTTSLSTHTRLQTSWQVVEQRVSEAWRHTHKHTIDKSLSPHTCQRTESCPHLTYNPHPHHHPNRSCHFFIFPRAHNAQSTPAPQMPTSSLDVRYSCSAVCSLSCCWGDDASGPVSCVPVRKGSEDWLGMTNGV